MERQPDQQQPDEHAQREVAPGGGVADDHTGQSEPSGGEPAEPGHALQHSADSQMRPPRSSIAAERSEAAVPAQSNERSGPEASYVEGFSAT
jgi:hypothetical protein